MFISIDAYNQSGWADTLNCTNWQLTFTTSLNTDQPNVPIGDEVIERSNGIASSTNTSHNNVWQFPFQFQHLLLNLLANDTLEVSDDSRERMWADSGAN